MMVTTLRWSGYDGFSDWAHDCEKRFLQLKGLGWFQVLMTGNFIAVSSFHAISHNVIPQAGGFVYNHTRRYASDGRLQIMVYAIASQNVSKPIGVGIEYLVFSIEFFRLFL